MSGTSRKQATLKDSLAVIEHLKKHRADYEGMTWQEGADIINRKLGCNISKANLRHICESAGVKPISNQGGGVRGRKQDFELAFRELFYQNRCLARTMMTLCKELDVNVPEQVSRTVSYDTPDWLKNGSE